MVGFAGEENPVWELQPVKPGPALGASLLVGSQAGDTATATPSRMEGGALQAKSKSEIVQKPTVRTREMIPGIRQQSLFQNQ